MDRTGNTIGIITEVDAYGLPRRIDLQAATSCSVIQRKGETKVKYRIDGIEYPEDKIWHERQYVVAGLPVGLSPIAYAAWSIGEYLSIQQFALDWFGGGGIPKARLRNTQKKLDGKEAGILKDRWKATVANGDLFVHGNDWEYNLMQAEQAGAEWIEGRKYGVADIARFFDVPGDLLEAPAHGSKLVYANITQKNLDFLIMHLGAAVSRREDNLSTLLPAPRYVKLNTDALLRMDAATRAQVLGQRLTTRQITPTEGRALENLPPFTDAQLAEIEKVYGPPKAAPVAAGTGTPPAPAAGK
jgi:HK97 family phage portal protein